MTSVGRNPENLAARAAASNRITEGAIVVPVDAHSGE
jgi:hypothetical protein